MKELLVIELEDARVRMLGVVANRKRTRVLFARSHALGDGDPVALLPQALDTVLESRDRRQMGVLLIISDRRIVQGFAREPQCPPPRVLPQVLRLAAQRVGMFSDDEQLTIGYADRPKAGVKGAWSAAFEAAPREIVEAHAKMLEAAGFARIWVTSIESMLAAGFAAGAEPIAVVDVRSDRARVLLAQHGAVLASRKLRINYLLQGGGDAIAPLCAEIARSLGFFAESHLPPAGRVLLLGSFSETNLADPRYSEILRLPVECAPRSGLAVLPGDLADREGWSVVALAVSGPLKQIPYLVEPPPAVRRHILKQLVLQSTSAAVVAIGLLYIWHALQESRRVNKEELAERRMQVASLERELERVQVSRTPPAIVVDRRAILAEQRLAMPVSRLCAWVASGRDPEVLLGSLKYDGRHLALEGVITAKDPLLVLRHFGELDRALRGLPTVTDGGGKLLGPNGTGGTRFEYWAECEATARP